MICGYASVPIDVLPDSILLEIFDFCRTDYYGHPIPFAVWGWDKQIQVCRRWRRIVFSSPRRLNLELLCTQGTPVRKNLGYWPTTLPIIVNYLIYSYYGSNNADPKDEDDVIAALEHPDRVRHVEVVVTSSLLEKMATAMQQPFTELTRLRVSSIDGRIMPVLPGSFLGGSAPHLRDILLDGIPFPSLPTLLSSASDLVTLNLYNIPQTGYISPEAMVTSLTASTRLITLSIRFQSPTPRPNQRLPAS
jgi:hypothetical protein